MTAKNICPSNDRINRDKTLGNQKPEVWPQNPITNPGSFGSGSDVKKTKTKNES